MNVFPFILSISFFFFFYRLSVKLCSRNILKKIFFEAQVLKILIKLEYQT